MATMTPVSPPAVKTARPPAIQSIGRIIFTRPTMRVATKAKSWMPVGMTTASEAAEKKPSDRAGSPVVNMWCTQRPKLMKPVPTAESTIQE